MMAVLLYGFPKPKIGCDHWQCDQLATAELRGPNLEIITVCPNHLEQFNANRNFEVVKYAIAGDEDSAEKPRRKIDPEERQKQR